MHDAALRLLTRREHSAAELAAKLRERGHEPTGIHAEIERLAAAGLQSDQRFAESYVSTRLERGDGPLKLRAALRERGIDGELIEAVLAPLEDEWTECALRAAERRFGTRPPGSWAERAKRARFLQGRGFPADIVRRVTDFDGHED